MTDPTTVMALLRGYVADVVYHHRRMYWSYGDNWWMVRDRFDHIVYAGDSEAKAVAALMGEKEAQGE